MSTVDISSNEFEEKVLKSNIPVLVDFWAPWCGPCKMAEPVLEQLSNEYDSKTLIAKVNVDENPDLASKYGVMSIPTTVLIKEGKEIGRKIGFTGKSAFEDLIKSGLK